MIALRALLSTNGALLAAIAIGGLLIYLDQSRVRRIRATAIAGQIQKTETANATVTKTGNAAASKSRTALPDDRGVRVLPEVAD